MWKVGVIHRDIKLTNILLDFPDNPELEHFDRKQKAIFLKNFNFTTGRFRALISDYGLSTVVDSEGMG